MAFSENVVSVVIKLLECIQFALKQFLGCGTVVYEFLEKLVSLIGSYFDSSEEQPEYLRRCTHNAQDDEHFDELLAAHDSTFALGRVATEDPFVGLFTKKITVTIPVVFHLLDPVLTSNTITYWTGHINKKILKQLNDDYNRTRDNYKTTYLNDVKRLFAQADISKYNHYASLGDALPHTVDVTWNFVLDKVVSVPKNGLSISTSASNNDRLFRAVTVSDPNKYLNIIIAPGSSILGIAVFPFTDRSPSDISKINPTYAYRNAILVNTGMFKGTVSPYNKYRTFTHEIGHWCGLLHPFDNTTYKSSNVVSYGLNKLDFDKTPVKKGEQDQDFVGDLIADTAPQTAPVYGTVYDSVKKTTTWYGSTQITRTGPYANIFSKNSFTPNFYNFMDYTDDEQMCMFTHLQVLHMIYLMHKFRPEFVTVQ